MDVCGKKSKMENLTKPDAEWINLRWKTLLWFAVYHANFEVVKFLVANHANYVIDDYDKEPLFLKSIRNHNEFAIDLLLRDIIGKDTENNNNDWEANSTLKKIANYSQNDESGFNSMNDNYNKSEPQSSMLRIFNKVLGNIILGSKRSKNCFNCGNTSTFTPCDVFSGDISLPRDDNFRLVFENVCVNSEYEENTPLNQALFDNNTNIVELLLAGGADPNIKIQGRFTTGLFYAIYHINLGLVNMLLKRGAKIDNLCEKLIEYLKINCLKKVDDILKIEKLLKYYGNVRKKIPLLILIREFGGDSVLSGETLPKDMFRVILNEIMNPDDEFLDALEKPPPMSIFGWLTSLLY